MRTRAGGRRPPGGGVWRRRPETAARRSAATSQKGLKTLHRIPHMPASPWSDWQPLALSDPPRDAGVLAELLDGGQAFRWRRLSPPSAPRSLGEARPHEPAETWLGVWSNCVAEVRLVKGKLQWRAPAGASPVTAEIVHYFGADSSHAAAVDSLPWRSDAHLARCLKEFPGLRILR